MLLVKFCQNSLWHGRGLWRSAFIGLEGMLICTSSRYCDTLVGYFAERAFAAGLLCYDLSIMLPITIYQVAPSKRGADGGRQRHPQGANLGSNGILKFLSKTDTMAATSRP